MPRLKLRGIITRKNRIRITTLGVSSLLSALALLVIPVLPAYADQSPSGCNSNRLNASIIKDKTAVFQGDTITYTVTISNANSGSDLACDITNATVSLTLPAADGTPSGTVIVLASGVDYPAGTSITAVGSAPYVVNVNPGVVDIVAQVNASGALHDAPVDHSAAIVKTLGTSVLTATPPSSDSEESGGSTVASSTISALRNPGLPNTGSRY